MSGMLHTIRKYPCGCEASGSGDVPAYCATHGLPPHSCINSESLWKQYMERPSEANFEEWLCVQVGRLAASLSASQAALGEAQKNERRYLLLRARSSIGNWMVSKWDQSAARYKPLPQEGEMDAEIDKALAAHTGEAER